VKDRLLRALDAVILVSESQRPYFERRLPAERIFVVPLGVDSEFFRPARQRPSERLCITVGEHHRDFETLGKAVELITREYPEARLWAAGTHRPSQRAPMPGPGVELAGRVSDEQLLAHYQSARVAVFCYRRATASIGLLEAMACGLPVVATDVGGVPEYLGEAGLLCPPGDPRAVADAVARLFSDDALARDLGLKARKRALEFDYRVVARRHAEVYSQIAALRAAQPRAPKASGEASA
jgi:glycosyltransferase involved in cell wall biosynthesis